MPESNLRQRADVLLRAADHSRDAKIAAQLRRMADELMKRANELELFHQPAESAPSMKMTSIPEVEVPVATANRPDE